MGPKTGTTQLLAADIYAPLYIDAEVPSGAFLNWSILNTAGEVIPGMYGSNDHVVPLNLLDHTMVDQFRLHLEFKGSGSGMPKVYSISGDGAFHESFWTDPVERGWTMNNAMHIKQGGTVVGPNSIPPSPLPAAGQRSVVRCEIGRRSNPRTSASTFPPQ